MSANGAEPTSLRQSAERMKDTTRRPSWSSTLPPTTPACRPRSTRTGPGTYEGLLRHDLDHVRILAATLEVRMDPDPHVYPLSKGTAAAIVGRTRELAQVTQVLLRDASLDKVFAL